MNPFQPLCDAIVQQYPELTAADLQFGPAPKVEVGDVALRRKMGKAGRALVERRYNIVSSVSEFSALYEELC